GDGDSAQARGVEGEEPDPGAPLSIADVGPHVVLAEVRYPRCPAAAGRRDSHEERHQAYPRRSANVSICRPSGSSRCTSAGSNFQCRKVSRSQRCPITGRSTVNGHEPGAAASCRPAARSSASTTPSWASAPPILSSEACLLTSGILSTRCLPGKCPPRSSTRDPSRDPGWP